MNVITRGVRNAFRNSIRTFSIVIILGLSIGLALTMLVARQAVEAKINSVMSSIGNTITISPAGARGFDGGGTQLTSDQVGKVKNLPHVVSVSQTLQDRLASDDTNLQSAVEAGNIGQRARRSNGGTTNGPAGGSFTPPIIVVGGNDTSSLETVGGGALSITDGQAFDAGSDSNVAMIGSGLATKNSLSVGSSFQAYGASITVVAIFDSGNRFANNLVAMPLASLQRLSQQPGSISSAIVQADSITNLDATVAAIKSTLGDTADVTNQQDNSAQALEPLENIKNISLFSLIGAVIAGAVIILLTMLMIVRERRREIGVLKAIGSSNLKIMTQFVTEAVTFTALGALIGLAIGVFAASPVTNLLVSSSANATQTMAQGRIGGGGGLIRLAGQGGANLQTIQASVGWSILFYGLLAAALIAIVGSAIPAWFIAKVRPAEVMRAE